MRSNSIPTDELFRIFLKLSMSYQLGIPTATIIKKIAERSTNKVVKQVFSTILRDLSEGSSISQAFAKHKCFPTECSHVIAVGEHSGNLALCFKEMAQHMRQMGIIRRQVFSALLPLVISVPFLLMAFLIFSFLILPKIEEIYESLNMPLPGFTMSYIQFTRLISEHPLLISAAITLLFFAVYRYLQRNREIRDRLILKIPFYHKIHYNFLQYKFCVLFRLLMNAGLSSVIALEKCAAAIGNELLANMLRNSAQAMRSEGFSLSQALSHNNRDNIFDPDTIDFFTDGDITVSLNDILEQQSEFFKSLVNTKSQDLGNKVGPILICIGFAFVIYFIISVQLPILMMSSATGV